MEENAALMSPDSEFWRARIQPDRGTDEIRRPVSGGPEGELRRPFDGATVLVTHHLPSYRSVAPNFGGHPLNPCYASNLDGLIERYKPALWIHGHTHMSCDYQLGATRVVCNPRGYVNHNLNVDFKAGLVLRI